MEVKMLVICCYIDINLSRFVIVYSIYKIVLFMIIIYLF